MSKNKVPRAFINSAQKCGIETILMKEINIPHLFAESDKIISSKGISGLRISSESFEKGVKIKLIIQKGVSIKKPIFLCFGILKEKGKQIILPEIILKENSEAKILTHCTFPKSKEILHRMEAKVKLEKGAKLSYLEKHYHGENFGAEVLPNFKISVDKGASFENEFILEQGSIGKLKVFFEIELEENAFCEVSNKIIGKGRKDKVEIYDKISLNGENSSSLIKLRGAIVKGGEMLFRGEIKAGEKAKNARGHIDCQEIVVGNSIAQSIPKIVVKNPEARITHEASIGKVNQKELETLMTRGLSEKEAIDFIIRGVI